MPGWFPLGRDDGLGVRREAMIGSIHYIWTTVSINLQLFVQGWFAGRNWRRAWGLDEVEMRVSDEGDLISAERKLAMTAAMMP